MPAEWGRTRDLPEEERAVFEKWLQGQTRPIIHGELPADQDGYYQWDYDRWKAEGCDTQQHAGSWD